MLELQRPPSFLEPLFEPHEVEQLCSHGWGSGMSLRSHPYSYSGGLSEF